MIEILNCMFNVLILLSILVPLNLILNTVIKIVRILKRRKNNDTGK